MDEFSKKIYLRIYAAGNFEYITSEFVDKLNSASLEYFHNAGVNAELLSPPELGGGGGLSLIYEILQYLYKGLLFLLPFLKKKAKTRVAASAPCFTVYFYSDDLCKDVIWEEDANIGTGARLLIFHLWQLIGHLKTKYPHHYQYEGEVAITVDSFDYTLSIKLPFNRTDNVSMGTLMKFIEKARLKANVDEKVVFGTGLLIRQEFIRQTNDARQVSTKKLYYLKFDRTLIFSAKTRGVILERTPKGTTIRAQNKKGKAE